VDGTGSGSCPTAGFDITVVELSGSVTIVLVYAVRTTGRLLTEQMGVMVTLCTCIQEIPGSDRGLVTDCSDCIFYFGSLQECLELQLPALPVRLHA
jgi:hypothetical protein